MTAPAVVDGLRDHRFLGVRNGMLTALHAPSWRGAEDNPASRSMRADR